MQQGQDEYIGQIRSWHSAMRNFFIINCFEHIQSGLPFDSTISSKKDKFVVFVRVYRDENSTSDEAQIEQRAQAAISTGDRRQEHQQGSREFSNHEFDELWI